MFSIASKLTDDIKDLAVYYLSLGFKLQLSLMVNIIIYFVEFLPCSYFKIN